MLKKRSILFGCFAKNHYLCAAFEIKHQHPMVYLGQKVNIKIPLDSCDGRLSKKQF